MGEMRADVFVRRLIERIGFRRHRLFAATPGGGRAAAQPLAPRRARRGLDAPRAPAARTATSSATWRRSPRPASCAREEPTSPPPGGGDARRARAGQGPRVRRASTSSACTPARSGRPAAEDRWVPPELAGERRPGAGRRAGGAQALAPRLPRDDPGAARTWSSRGRRRPRRRAGPPVAVLRGRPRGARRRRGGMHGEELFGPAEGLHSTYRMIRDEVLEASWRAGRRSREMRLDTADGRQPRRRPLPGAGQARRADPAARPGAGGRRAGGHQRPARPVATRRSSARRCETSGARRLPPRRGARAQAARAS